MEKEYGLVISMTNGAQPHVTYMDRQSIQNQIRSWVTGAYKDQSHILLTCQKFGTIAAFKISEIMSMYEAAVPSGPEPGAPKQVYRR